MNEDDITPLIQEPPSSPCHRLTSVLRNITVEPVAIMSSTAVALQSIATHNLWLYKVCHTNLHYPEDLCVNLTANKTVQTEVQKIVADYYLYLSLLKIIPSIFVTILMGAWADKHGRKFPMILAKLGFFFFSLNFFVCSSFKCLRSEYLFIGYCFLAVSGGTTVFNTALWSYLSAITSEKSRAFRFGVMETALIMPLFIGILVGGKMHETWGYLPVFGTSCVLYFVCLIYLSAFIHDPPGENPTNQDSVRDVFRVSNFVESARILFKRRQGYRRTYLLLLTLALWMMSVPADSGGEPAIALLFAQMKFKMTLMEFSKYSAVGAFCAFGGLLILLPILTKIFKLSDILVALIGSVAKVINPIIVAFASKVWILYTASSLLVFYPFCFPAMRAQISKLVPEKEKSKVFAMTFALEAVIPLFSGVLYTRLYRFSMTTFPGAVYLLSAGFMAVAAVALIFIYIHMKTVSHPENEEISSGNQEDVSDQEYQVTPNWPPEYACFFGQAYGNPDSQNVNTVNRPSHPDLQHSPSVNSMVY